MEHLETQAHQETSGHLAFKDQRAPLVRMEFLDHLDLLDNRVFKVLLVQQAPLVPQVIQDHKDKLDQLVSPELLDLQGLQEARGSKELLDSRDSQVLQGQLEL